MAIHSIKSPKCTLGGIITILSLSSRCGYYLRAAIIQGAASIRTDVVLLCLASMMQHNTRLLLWTKLETTKCRPANWNYMYDSVSTVNQCNECSLIDKFYIHVYSPYMYLSCQNLPLKLTGRKCGNISLLHSDQQLETKREKVNKTHVLSCTHCYVYC